MRVTIGTKVKKALSDLKSAQADFESFALEVQDQASKQVYADAARQTRHIAQRIEEQVRRLEKEEPQYKGY